MAEKQVALSVESKDSNSDDEGFTWTEEEEKALVRRYADSSPPMAAKMPWKLQQIVGNHVVQLLTCFINAGC